MPPKGPHPPNEQAVATTADMNENENHKHKHPQDNLRTLSPNPDEIGRDYKRSN